MGAYAQSLEKQRIAFCLSGLPLMCSGALLPHFAVVHLQAVQVPP